MRWWWTVGADFVSVRVLSADHCSYYLQPIQLPDQEGHAAPDPLSSPYFDPWAGMDPTGISPVLLDALVTTEDVDKLLGVVPGVEGQNGYSLVFCQ
jgi:hypothetical protein